MYASAFAATTDKSNDWIIDSGATSRVCINKNLFQNLQPHKKIINMADDTKCQCEYKGTVVLETKYGIMTLNNTLYMPRFHSNFFSVRMTTVNDCEVNYKKHGARIVYGDRVLATARVVDERNKFDDKYSR